MTDVDYYATPLPAPPTEPQPARPAWAPSGTLSELADDHRWGTEARAAIRALMRRDGYEWSFGQTAYVPASRRIYVSARYGAAAVSVRSGGIEAAALGGWMAELAAAGWEVSERQPTYYKAVWKLAWPGYAAAETQRRADQAAEEAAAAERAGELGELAERFASQLAAQQLPGRVYAHGDSIVFDYEAATGLLGTADANA